MRCCIHRNIELQDQWYNVDFGRNGELLYAQLNLLEPEEIQMFEIDPLKGSKRRIKGWEGKDLGFVNVTFFSEKLVGVDFDRSHRVRLVDVNGNVTAKYELPPMQWISQPRTEVALFASEKKIGN